MQLSRLIPARLREGADALRRRDFRNVFLAQSVSVFGDGITPVALTFAVLDLTGSGTDLGFVLATHSVPLVLLTGTAQIWQLAVLAACHGAAEAFFRPAAGAILPQLVPPGQLQQANARMGMSDNFGWMVGPAVAGVLVAVIGAGGTIAVDGAAFLVSAAFLTRLRVPAVTTTVAAVHGFGAELRAGWREVKSRTWLWVMLLRVCLVLCIVIAPFQILGALGLLEEGYGAAVWGWLQAVFSAGMIVGMVIAVRYRPKRPMITVTLTGSTAVAAPFALAIFGDPWVLGGVYVLRGVTVGILVAVWNTTLQTQIAKELLGRVTAWD